MGSFFSTPANSTRSPQEPLGKTHRSGRRDDAELSPPRKRPRHSSDLSPRVETEPSRPEARSNADTRGLEAPVIASHRLRTVRDEDGELHADVGEVPLYSASFLRSLAGSESILRDTLNPEKDAYGEKPKGPRQHDDQVNFITHETRRLLRKRSMPLPRSEAVIQELSKRDASVVGSLADREVRKLDIRGKLFLAPLTTNGNLPFRRVCKKFGVDVTCGEMALAEKLLQGQNSEWALMRRHASEDIFGVQLCGSNEGVLTRAAELVARECMVDFVDVNAGCPIDIIYKRGAGCSLMARANKFSRMVATMSSVMDVPLSVKVRMGIETSKLNAHELIPRLGACGAAWVTVHGRTRKQRYSRLADWSYIRGPCATAASQAGIPLIGNGDIYNWRDVHDTRSHGSDAGPAGSGVHAVMLARGALIKPWLATEIKEQRDWDISASERLDMYKDYCGYGLDHWGSDRRGVETTRRFLLEMLSFAHRYVPVGLLEAGGEHVSMTHRSPVLRGRNELESLFASQRSQDWMRVSEMMLGPVPSGFSFQARHKSNAWGADSALNG